MEIKNKNKIKIYGECTNGFGTEQIKYVGCVKYISDLNKYSFVQGLFVSSLGEAIIKKILNIITRENKELIEKEK